MGRWAGERAAQTAWDTWRATYLETDAGSMPAQLSRDEAAAIEDELELDNDGFMSVGQELEKDSGLFLPGEQEFAPMTEKPAREVFQEQLILSAATNDINRLKAALHVCAKDVLGTNGARRRRRRHGQHLDLGRVRVSHRIAPRLFTYVGGGANVTGLQIAPSWT